MVLKPIMDNGWKMEENRLKIVWDSDDNVHEIRERLSLLRGCKCVTGCASALKKKKLCRRPPMLPTFKERYENEGTSSRRKLWRQNK